jgi:WXG100 family type VII secretion target
MSSDGIAASPGDLRAAAHDCDRTGNSIVSELNQLKSRLEALGWQGRARQAFDEMFSAMHHQLLGVQQQLGSEGGVGALLNGSADGYDQHEEAMVNQFLGNRG